MRRPDCCGTDQEDDKKVWREMRTNYKCTQRAWCVWAISFEEIVRFLILHLLYTCGPHVHPMVPTTFWHKFASPQKVVSKSNYSARQYLIQIHDSCFFFFRKLYTSLLEDFPAFGNELLRCWRVLHFLSRFVDCGFCFRNLHW